MSNKDRSEWDEKIYMTQIQALSGLVQISLGLEDKVIDKVRQIGIVLREIRQELFLSLQQQELRKRRADDQHYKSYHIEALGKMDSRVDRVEKNR